MNTLMQQYHTIKKKYKDAILLFRAGNSFETFNEDAAILGERMGTSVIEPDENAAIKKAARLPFDTLDKALRTLTKAGYKVAVCEELEEPKTDTIKEGLPTPILRKSKP